MLLKSFSKINLSLGVNKKLNNGLHDIQSYYCLINLFDEIKVKKIKNNFDKIIFKGKFATSIKKSNNSILNTLSILRKKNIISNFYSIIVNKKIPIFAGLGGGTSNSVYLIKHLTEKKNIKNILSICEKRIGSDMRLFLNEKGYLYDLNTVNSFKIKYKLHFLLVYPNIKCSTRYIYSKIKNYTSKSRCNFKRINNKSKFIKLLLEKSNDLQPVVERKYPIIKKLITEVGLKKGCYFSRMTGSGSVCYGVFQSEKTAKAALTSVKYKYPKYWSVVAKTI